MITFLTVNVPGSNNNLGRTPEMDIEWADRLAADLDWIAQGFASARRADSRGIVIIWQGNPRFERQPDDNLAYAPLLEALEEEVRAFARPVLLVHGDTHYFRVDKPLPPGGLPRAEEHAGAIALTTSRAWKRSASQTTIG